MRDLTQYVNRRITVVFLRVEQVHDLLTGAYLHDTSRKTRKTINTPSLLNACRKIRKSEAKNGAKVKFLAAYMFTGPKSWDWKCIAHHPA